VHVFVSELTDSYLSKYKSYRMKHMLKFFLQWSMTKMVKYIRKYLLFQYERLKYYRLNIKCRIKIYRKNKSTEQFSDFFTQGHIVGQHLRKQHEGISIQPCSGSCTLILCITNHFYIQKFQSKS